MSEARPTLRTGVGPLSRLAAIMMALRASDRIRLLSSRQSLDWTGGREELADEAARADILDSSEGVSEHSDLTLSGIRPERSESVPSDLTSPIHL